MASPLIACAGCGCHAKSIETHCPSCGEPLRRSDGTVPRATASMLLGLTTAAAMTAMTACGSDTGGGTSGGGASPAYGIAQTTSSSGAGGAGGAGGGPSAAYGIAQTTSSSTSGGGGGAAAYGIAQTTSSSSGGTGGTGGGNSP